MIPLPVSERLLGRRVRAELVEGVVVGVTYDNAWRVLVLDDAGALHETLVAAARVLDEPRAERPSPTSVPRLKR